MMNQKPHVLAFLGPVGVGKSTQMKLLASKLRDNGLKTRNTSFKANHLLTFLLIRILAKMLGESRKSVSPIRALINYRSTFLKKIFKLWLALDIFSISLKFLLTIYFPVKIGYIVLVEEYIPATIANYMYYRRVLGLPSRAIYFLLSFMPKLMHQVGHTEIIFLDAPTSTLKLHWSSRGSSDERTDYIHMQHTALLSLARKLSSPRILYINVKNQTVKETHERILNYSMKFMKK